MKYPKDIPFNKAYIAGKELHYISQAVINGDLKGDGPFTIKCQEWLENQLNIKQTLLTHSCTAALEMSVILSNIGKDDEVLLPSYTFTSTANAILLRDAKPVFVDICDKTLNIDHKLLETHIGPRSRAILPVHYAGVGCEMDSIMSLANKNNLVVIEDVAHAITAKYKDQWLGSIGHLGCFSFHETKNFSSGEGGAIALNQADYIQRAEIIREKGTNRSQFFRGEIDKYSWVDMGSSYLPSEVVAAFLYGQLEQADKISKLRMQIWNKYNDSLAGLEANGDLRLPFIPEYCEHNAHMFYVVTNSHEDQQKLIQHLRKKGINAVFHYVPLHCSPMGERLGYKAGQLPVTENISARLVRFPLYCELTSEQQDLVIDAIISYYQDANMLQPAVANLF